MKKISDLILQLETNVKHHEITAPVLSNGSVGWHITHTLLVMNAVIDALRKSIPGTYKNTYSLKRSFVMITGRIPRGKVKAPTAVQPDTTISLAALEQEMMLTKENIKKTAQLSSEHFFRHPFMGDFKLKPALRFIIIHTKHHLKIINEIITLNKEG